MRNNKHTAILAVEIETPQSQQQQQSSKKKDKSPSKKNIMFQIYRPNTGLQVRHESLAELEKKYKKVSSSEAENHWTQQYDASVNTCSHAYWNNNCRNVTLGNECEVSNKNFFYKTKKLLSIYALLGGFASKAVPCACRIGLIGLVAC